MKKIGIISTALLLGFAMSSSFAAWGHHDKIEIKNIRPGAAQTANLPNNIASGDVVVCKSDIKTGTLTVSGLDRDYRLDPRTHEIKGLFNGTNGSMGNVLRVTASSDIAFNHGKDLKCSIEKHAKNKNM